ncbi:PREDICTED: uncharacterized protein LOC104822988 [Tarenaya hassleriana]|uniref:uncharacterized protein LOC104822988 n=1 Tax=Tarenaya hassleriana TaxID=28532 RepID=UPI00053C83D6|nr:PREDICTED: uncharacterized protein LOC104822988 [Tarenaya hassleriana]
MPNPPATVKFLCSYGGRILPRYPDGNFRYHGGNTRVLSLPRPVSFYELMTKLGVMCGMATSLRCQLPAEDLDALITVTSDEDLANLMDEYDKASSAPKIRAFLSPIKSADGKKTSAAKQRGGKCVLCLGRWAERMRSYGRDAHCHREPTLLYLIHNGNHWQ